MYLYFHGFKEKPFNLTPDPRFVFLSKIHREAFAHLLYGINNQVGFITLTGEVGSGKTTVLRSLLNHLDSKHHRIGMIFNPYLSPVELLQNINREFNIPYTLPHSSSLLESLNQFLLEQKAEGRMVVLAIDEAQDLDTSVLEQIRLISNLETDKEKLIQIILSGQPELIEILKRNEMRQLAQRITVRYHLHPMDFQDTIQYIHYRLDIATGGKSEVAFSKGALKKIYRFSHGLPRLINLACDRILLASYARNQKRIDSRIASVGIKDIKKYTPSERRWRPILIPTLLIFSAFVAGIIYVKWTVFIHWVNPIRQEQKVQSPIQKNLPVSGEKFPRLTADDLFEISESESARRAFNILASLWKLPPVPPEKYHLFQSDEIEHEVQDRELRLYRFSGNMGSLLRLNYPTLLELTMPGIQGKRFISLIGIENDSLLIEPPIAMRKSLPYNELEKYWSGQGYLLWKDFLNLMAIASPQVKGDSIKRLQELLREVGVFHHPSTGAYDADTKKAVMRFQALKGIEQDGIVGSQTLMLLYQSIDRFGVPRLRKGKE